jgi:hypothetical protein
VHRPAKQEVLYKAQGRYDGGVESDLLAKLVIDKKSMV